MIHSYKLFIYHLLFLDNKKGRSRLQGSIKFPDINIVFFQCGMIEKTIHAESLEDSVSRLARNSVVLLRFHKTTLYLSSSSSHRVNTFLQISWFQYNFIMPAIAMHV